MREAVDDRHPQAACAQRGATFCAAAPLPITTTSNSGITASSIV